MHTKIIAKNYSTSNTLSTIIASITSPLITSAIALIDRVRFTPATSSAGDTGLDHKDHLGNTPLMLAIRSNDFMLAVELIEKGANSNATNLHGDTPMLLAIKRSNFDLARLLVEKGANVNARNKDGYTPYIGAYLQDEWSFLEYLIGRGARREGIEKPRQAHNPQALSID